MLEQNTKLDIYKIHEVHKYYPVKFSQARIVILPLSFKVKTCCWGRRKNAQVWGLSSVPDAVVKGYLSHICYINWISECAQIAPEYSGLSISQNSIITTVFQTNPFHFSFSIFNPQSTHLTQFSTAAKSMGLWSHTTNSILILHPIQTLGLLSITVWCRVCYLGKLFSASVCSSVRWEWHLQGCWGTNGKNR